MARRIRSLRPATGAPAKYPWDRWTDGSAWRITRGEDFDVAPSSMSAIIRSHARRNALYVATRTVGDAIEFQFVSGSLREMAA